MIIKWDKGESLYKGHPDFPDDMVDNRWEAGSVEFCEDWLHITEGKSESFARYDRITHISFWGISVSWRAREWDGLWTPKAREIYDELMIRTRALFLAGKGVGQLVGKVS